MSSANQGNKPDIASNEPQLDGSVGENSQLTKKLSHQNTRNNIAEGTVNTTGNSLKGSTIQNSNRITRKNSKDGNAVNDKEKEEEIQNEQGEEVEEENNYVHISCTSRLGLYEIENQLKEAKDFYVQKLGVIKELPLKYLDSPKVSMIKLSEIIEALSMVDVQPTEQGIYWLGQLMYILPLPPFWDIKRKSKDNYIFEYQQRIESQYPPSLLYFDYLIEEFRRHHKEILESESVINYKYTPPSTQVSSDEKNNPPKNFNTDDIRQGLEKEMRRNKRKYGKANQNGFWQRIHIMEKKGKIYSDPPYREKKKVYKDTEPALKSNYLYYKPSGVLEQQKMEQLWEDRMNKQIAEKRTAEEFIHHMKKWANARQRMETEINRKAGQSYSGSRYEHRAFRLTNNAYENFRQESAIYGRTNGFMRETRNIQSAWRSRVGKNTKYSGYQSTRPGTVGSQQRPYTGSTVYYHKRGDTGNKRGVLGQMFRKQGGRAMPDEFQRRRQKGYYRDLNNSRDSANRERSIEASIESSVEIVEDNEELDAEDEAYLENLEKGAIGGQIVVKNGAQSGPYGGLPQIIDQTNTQKRPMTVTSTYTKSRPVYLKTETVIDSEHGEKYINKKRINMMRARSNMKLEYDPQNDPNFKKFQHRTLSVYGKKQKQYDMVDRPFSAIMGYNQIKFRRNNQLREIEDIKNRLNRNKVNLPLRKIEKALLNPLEEEILIQEDGGTYNLPAAGEGLMNNALFKKKKKRKGRRRKGGKRGKSGKSRKKVRRK